MRFSNYKFILLLVLSLIVLFSTARAAEMEFDADDLELRAEELIIDDLNRQIIASGNVVLKQGELRIDSERIEADDILETIVATGSVVLARNEEVLAGQRLEMDLTNNRAYLTGEPYYENNGFLIRGTEFEFDYNTEFLLVKGNVNIEDEDEGLFASADRMEYDLTGGEIILYDNVEVKRDGRIMTAQKVIIDTETRKITAQGTTRLKPIK